jgi:hypothetical protein
MSELELFLLTGVLTPNFNTMDLVKFLEKNQKLHIHIIAVGLKVTSCRTISKKKKEWKTKMLWSKQTFFWKPCPSALGSFSHMAACRSSLENTLKNELNTCFQQKFAMGSYGVGIGRAWCSWKACEICSSHVLKEKLKEKKKSSHKLPKQQSTSFLSQGILRIKLYCIYNTHIYSNLNL